jgi:hypothetical protein
VVTKEEVEKLKESYDKEAEKLFEMQEKLPSELREEYSKLDTLEDFERKYLEEIEKEK